MKVVLVMGDAKDKGKDGLEELRRAVALAQDLRVQGFDVAVAGNLDITAAWPLPPAKPSAPEPAK